MRSFSLLACALVAGMGLARAAHGQVAPSIDPEMSPGGGYADFNSAPAPGGTPSAAPDGPLAAGNGGLLTPGTSAGSSLGYIDGSAGGGALGGTGGNFSFGLTTTGSGDDAFSMPALGGGGGGPAGSMYNPQTGFAPADDAPGDNALGGQPIHLHIGWGSLTHPAAAKTTAAKPAARKPAAVAEALRHFQDGQYRAATRMLAAPVNEQGVSPGVRQLYGVCLFANDRVSMAAYQIMRSARADPAAFFNNPLLRQAYKDNPDLKTHYARAVRFGFKTHHLQFGLVLALYQVLRGHVHAAQATLAGVKPRQRNRALLAAMQRQLKHLAPAR